MDMVVLFLALVVALLVVLNILNKLTCFWCQSKVCLVGKTAVVTGGASGIGYETALALAARGCRVIIADVIDSAQVVETLIDITHNPNIISKQVDLQSFTSVRKFAEDLLATEARLNILVCNAGITEFGFGKYTEDGLQRTMQVNYFSHFLLTHLLLDVLKKSSPSRVTFTSSIAAYISFLTVDTLNPKQEYFSTLQNLITQGCYTNSKLAITAASKEFGERLRGTGVTVNAVHPAGVNTSLFRSNLKTEGSFLVLLAWTVVGMFGKNCEEGAQTLIHLATSDKVANITGKSFYEGRTIPRPFQLNNKDFCQKLWERSIEYTKLEPHEIQC